MLVIATNAVEKKPIDTTSAEITWETCEISTWLNSYFYNAAFSDTEKSRIILSKVAAEVNPENGKNPGNDTTDRLFFLSLNEAKIYFAKPQARRRLRRQHLHRPRQLHLHRRCKKLQKNRLSSLFLMQESVPGTFGEILC